MKLVKLVRPKNNDARFYYDNDVNLLVLIAKSFGYKVSHSDARWVWERHSHTMAAGWLRLYEEDLYILRVLLQYLEVEDDDCVEV